MAIPPRPSARTSSVGEQTSGSSSTKPGDAVYPALLPLWNNLQSTIAHAQTQALCVTHATRVSFVGRFKTGKSHLINALIGADALPSDLDECTAYLVELAHNSQEKAVRLVGPDLDTAAEELITISQFKEFVDLTKTKKPGLADGDAFRYYLNKPMLEAVRLIDTPGFDGTNSEMRERGEQARERAIRSSHLCVLVLSAGIGPDDVECARLIHQHGVEMVVVLNQSDKYDSDARLEIQMQVHADLGIELGVKPSFYACSALWQSGSEEDREELRHQRRFFEDEDKAQWHQWKSLLDRLSRPLQGKRHISLLTTIHQAFDIAVKLNDQYDVTQQAEAVFLEHLPRWKGMMLSLVGQTVLELAVSAARSGKPLPWKRLQNFGIHPENVAPENILPLRELNGLLETYQETLSEVARLAVAQHSALLYRFILSEVSAFEGFIKKEFETASDLPVILEKHRKDVLWYSEPLRTDFTYEGALSELQKRWDNYPDRLWNPGDSTMENDCARIRHRLAAALI